MLRIKLLQLVRPYTPSRSWLGCTRCIRGATVRECTVIQCDEEFKINQKRFYWRLCSELNYCNWLGRTLPHGRGSVVLDVSEARP
jgi:hypothetical protein